MIFYILFLLSGFGTTSTIARLDFSILPTTQGHLGTRDSGVDACDAPAPTWQSCLHNIPRPGAVPKTYVAQSYLDPSPSCLRMMYTFFRQQEEPAPKTPYPTQQLPKIPPPLPHQLNLGFLCGMSKFPKQALPTPAWPSYACSVSISGTVGGLSKLYLPSAPSLAD